MRIFLILLSVVLLSGCLPPTQSQLRTENDLEELKRRLAQLEVQNIDISESKKTGGETQQRQIAELVAGLDNLRVELQSINGRIDDLGRDNRGISDELQLIKDDLGLQLSSLETRVAVLEKPATVAVDQPGQAASKKTPEVAATKLSPEQLYEEALDLIRKEKKFAEGRKKLETFVAKYKDHDLYVNALYWIGESYYGDKMYEEAILQFQDVISKYPKHQKASAAMLKQALAFNGLGDSENARTTMQKLIEEYPNSSQVPAAKKYLEKKDLTRNHQKGRYFERFVEKSSVLQLRRLHKFYVNAAFSSIDTRG